MNQEKIGEFIVILRKKNGLSQKDLAKKIGVTRQAISNWELGKVIPDNNSLKKLSNIFCVSIEEILSGEHITKENKKKKNIVIVLLIGLLLILFSCILLYFFHQNSKNYVINLESDNVSITNGIIVLRKNDIYFYLGKIVSKEEKKVTAIELFYIDDEKENRIYSCTNCVSDEIIIRDTIDKNTYFDVKNINYILNNMYVRISFDDNNYSIFKIKKDKSINDLKDKKIANNHSKNNDLMITNNEIMNIISTKFNKQDDGYVYKNNQLTIMYLDNNLSIYINENNIVESFNYNLLSGHLFYEKQLNQVSIDNQIINTKEDIEDNTIVKKFNEILENIN